jgi:hypothetical protein
MESYNLMKIDSNGWKRSNLMKKIKLDEKIDHKKMIFWKGIAKNSIFEKKIDIWWYFANKKNTVEHLHWNHLSGEKFGNELPWVLPPIEMYCTPIEIHCRESELENDNGWREISHLKHIKEVPTLLDVFPMACFSLLIVVLQLGFSTIHFSRCTIHFSRCTIHFNGGGTISKLSS